MGCSRQSLFGSHLILLNLFRPTLQEKCLYAELFCIPCSVFSRIRTGSLRFQSECGKKWTRIALNTETFHRVLRRPYYSDSTKNEIFALECFQFCLSLGFYLSLNTERSIPVQNEGKLLRYTEDSNEANRNLLLLYKNLNLELIFLIT